MTFENTIPQFLEEYEITDGYQKYEFWGLIDIFFQHSLSNL